MRVAILSIALTLVAAAPAPPVQPAKTPRPFSAPRAAELAITIDGPDELDVGDYAQLQVRGIPVTLLQRAKLGYWPRENVIIIPGQSWAGDPYVLIQAKSPGRYLIWIAAPDTDKAQAVVAYVEHEITVGGSVPVPVPPSPGPAPDPPSPDPPSDFAAAIATAFAAVPESARTRSIDVTMPDGNTITTTAAAAIAKNYHDVATEAAALPGSWDPALMVDEVKTRHSQVLSVAAMVEWQPFWKPLAAAMVGLGLAADDLGGHVKAFETIAEVLGK